MRISHLSLHNFGRHAALELDLAPGLTIVRGPNEAGKSTIQAALEAVLFRLPTSIAADVMERRGWSSPDQPSELAIELEAAGQRGRLVKRFERSHGTVELTLGGQTLNDPAQVQTAVSELTGLPSEKFMRATASIHHHELVGLHHDEQTLRDRLQRSISGAGSGTKAARRKLEERIARYKSEGVKNPGTLKAARDEVARLRAVVDAGDQALARLTADRQALADARTVREAAEHQLAAARAERDELARAAKLMHERDEADARYRRYRRASELRAEIDAAPPAPIERPAPSLAPAGQQVQAPRGRRSAPPWTALGVALIGGAGVILAAAVGWGGTGLVPIAAVALAIAALGVGLSYAGLRASSAALGPETPEPLPPPVEPTPAASDTARAEGELAGLLGDESGLSREELTHRRDAAADEFARSRHALEALGDGAHDAQRRLAERERLATRLNDEREAASRDEERAAGRLTANEVDAERVAADAEALAGALDRLAAAERRLRVYTLCLTALDAAEQKTMKKVARFLEEEMSGAIGRLTGGRYKRLRVDEQTLGFSVWAPERADWVDASSLSQGTVDALYLCARLGIIREVTAPDRPPLVLDDPFVTFDDGRAQRATELLRELAADHQVILLSTSDRYDAIADKVIVLPGPDGPVAAAPRPAVAPRVQVPARVPRQVPLSVGLWPEES